MKISVEVLGTDLSIETSEKEAEYVRQVAAHVNRVSDRVAGKGRELPRDRVAAMTAMELADENLRRAGSALPPGRASEARAAAIIDRIDRALRETARP